MKLNAVAKRYDKLTAEERFCLILAAGARGDEAERNRLVNAGGCTTLSIPDHAPYAHALDDLAMPTFMGLVEMAASYLEAFHLLGDDDRSEDAGEEVAGEDGIPEAEEEAGGVPAEGASDNDSAQYRTLDLALAQGFLLRTMADGWKLFCERVNLPPFVLWNILPGFDRLQRALKLAEQAAFAPEGMQRWLNAIRPAGKPEVAAADLASAESIADAFETAFRQRVKWWGG
jgi:hypothetical protein